MPWHYTTTVFSCVKIFFHPSKNITPPYLSLGRDVFSLKGKHRIVLCHDEPEGKTPDIRTWQHTVNVTMFDRNNVGMNERFFFE